MQSAYCQRLPYACMTRLKIDRFLMEINYLDDLFNVVYRKFLNAIDHIEYHSTLQNELSSTLGVKILSSSLRQVFITLLICRLSPTGELFLDKLLTALENMNLTITQKFRRMKRHSILTWVLGWGVFSNS